MTHVYSSWTEVETTFQGHRLQNQNAENLMLSSAEINPQTLLDAVPAGRFWRCFVTTAAICFLAIAQSPSSSAATCGSYLFRNGKPVGEAVSSMHPASSMSGGHEMSPQENESPGDTANLPVPPCHGPNCSGAPVPLAPVPAAPINLIRGFDQAAILESLAQLPAAQCGIEIPESERGALFLPSSIFRPPIA